MEWVETTGKSVEEAKELALDRLGVLEAEAELEIVEEPRAGMFGRVRGTARVRARVRPSAPPSKSERSRRRSKRDGGQGDSGEKGSGEKGSGENGSGDRDSAASAQDDGRRARDAEVSGPDKAGASGSKKKRSGAGRSGAKGSDDASSDGTRSSKGGNRTDREPMPEDEQRAVGEQFLKGLLEGFGYEGSLSSSLDSQGILAFGIEGDQLGLLIGPGLNTMDAIQEVCRNAIQRQADGREYGKVVLDVNGVRADRTAALEDFVRSEATKVAESGEDVIFEVMSRSDRKIVHDVISQIDGVSTESVGEDPRRRVVLRTS